MRRYISLIGAAIFASGVSAAQFAGVFSGTREHPAIAYETHPLRDPVSKLNQRLRDGRVQLKFDGPSGYLRSVLDLLNIPVESQMAVFSKTSLQASIISPQNPRTIFFNDSVAVAWVRGEPFVEVASHDPEQGVIFYLLPQFSPEQNGISHLLPQFPADGPPFIRRDGLCLQCHESYGSLGLPGTLLRSVFPAANGLPVRTLGDYQADHRTPFDQRWGGWFVTGKTGSLRHMGNTVFPDPADAASHTTIDPKIDKSVYLSPYSDVVALTVFEHQMRMINLLTRLGWEVRFAAYEKKPFDLAAAAKEVVDYMLFVDEPGLPGKIEGTSGFAEKFAERGPRDRKGRSLRQFDLETRLMRYPCSYMIYSDAFDALPVEAKAAVYQGMWQVLSVAKNGNAIVEILRDIKKDLPEYFQVR
jgi:hypothetical protein